MIVPVLCKKNMENAWSEWIIILNKNMYLISTDMHMSQLFFVKIMCIIYCEGSL